MNRVFLIGNLGRDPETRYIQTGTAVCSFTVATTRRWTKDGNKQEETNWHNITAWGKLAEICGKYLSKGSKVAVEGEIEYQSWGEEGAKKYKTVIRASNVEFLSPKGELREEMAPAPTADDDDGSIPF